MALMKNLSSKVKAQMKNLSKALLRRKSKASTTATSTTAIIKESNKLSPKQNEHASALPAENDGLLSHEASNTEDSGLGEGLPQYRQLPSFGSLSRIVISYSSQFDLENVADAGVVTSEIETEPEHADSPSNPEFDVEDSIDSTSNTDLDMGDSADISSVSCETKVRQVSEDHAAGPSAPRARIPMVERSEVCFSPPSSLSSNSLSMGNENIATTDEDEDRGQDSRYYGVCEPFDFRTATVKEQEPEDSGDAEPELSEEFVASWRARHGYN